MEAQSGWIVDEHRAAARRDRHGQQRDLARRQGNERLGNEVRKWVDYARQVVAN
jgi:hypothetical protein